MTARRIRDLHRILEAEADRFGASVRLESTNGGHVRGIFSIGDQQTFIITSYSPSSAWCQHRQVRAEARRALRSLTQQQCP